jgi:glucose-1-phosphatase
MLNLNRYETLILDLGGVIIDIFPQRVVDELQKMANGSLSSEEIWAQIKSGKLIERHEVGILTDEAFLLELSTIVNCSNHEAIRSAWCMMLGDIPIERIRTIEKLKKTHKVFLLSNTNGLHFLEIEGYLKKTYDISAYTLFDQVFLSHEIGFRKPNIDIYEQVLIKSGVAPESAVFVDDVFENAKGAELVGIEGYHLDLNKYKLDQIFEYE